LLFDFAGRMVEAMNFSHFRRFVFSAVLLGGILISLFAAQDGMLRPGVWGPGSPECADCDSNMHVIVVEMLVPPGTYQRGPDPSCTPEISQRVTDFKKSATRQVDDLMPGSGEYVGPVIADATGKLVDQIQRANNGGALGGMLNSITGQGPATCRMIMAVIPKGMIHHVTYYQIGDGARGWGLTSKDGNDWWVASNVGQAKFIEQPDISGEKGTIVSALFMNWSHDRDRWAVMKVRYGPR